MDASHNYQLTITENNKCVWKLSNLNEPISHGYITYVVKAKPSVQVGDIISNKAAIYFDYNLPVFTNTEKTTIVADALPLKLLTFTAKKEGKTNRLQWSTANEVNVDHFEIERSGNGREYGRMQNVKCKMQNGSSYNFTDNSPLTTHNYYRLKIVDKDGRFEYSPVRTINNSGNFYISVYPNPAKDKLQVQIESDKNTTLQVQVVAQDGKVLISQQWNVNEGTAIKILNVSALQSGSYFLKMTSGDKDQIVVKFEKL